MPIDKGTTLPITQLSGLQINYKDSNSCFNLPIMTTDERDALINTNDPANRIKNGTMIFNSDNNLVQYYQIKNGVGVWISVAKGAGTGDVVGPNSSTTGNLASFSNDSGKEIQDSGIKVVQKEDAASILTDTPLYELSNLKILHFGNIDVPGSIDTATIMMDGFTPITFQTQKLSPAEEIICSVFNGELGAGSSSPSAILEINSTVGAFLNARLNIAQRDALVSPQDGMLIFNTESKTLESRQNGEWITLGTGNGDGTVTAVGLINNDSNLTITGSPVTEAGDIEVNLKPQLAIKTITLNNTNNHGYTLSSPASLAQNLTLTLPDNSGTAGQILSTDGKGNTSWVNDIAGGTVTSVGLTNTDSNLTITGGPVTQAGNIEVDLKSQIVLKTVTLNNTSGYGYTLSSPVGLGSSINFTLPTSSGIKGQILSTDGQGNTSWVADIAGGTVTSVSLTNTDSNLTITGGPVTQAGNIEVDLKSQIVLKTITLNNLNNYGYTLASPAGLNSNKSFVLPSTSGISGQILSTDGQGNTNWVDDIAGGTVTSVGLTNTDSNLTITGSPVTTSGNIAVNLNPILNGITSVNLANNGKAISLSAPLGLSNNLTFVLPGTNGTVGQILSTDGKGNTSWVNDIAGGTVTSVGLTNTDSNLTITGGPVTQAGNIAVNLKPQLAIKSVTLNNTNNYGYTLSSPNGLGSNLNFTLPTSSGIKGQILSTDGQGNTNWVDDIAGGTVTSVGLTNTDSNLTITGSPVTTSGNIAVNLNKNLNNINTLNLSNSNNKAISLSASSALSSNLNFVLPSTIGTSGQVLSTDGQGNTSWVNNTGGSGTVTSVGLTNTDNNLTITGSPVTTSGSISVQLSKALTITTLNTNNVNADSVESNVILGNYLTISKAIQFPGSGGNNVSFSGPTTIPSSGTNFVLPNTNGTAGYVLSTDGKGNTSWITTASANSTYLLTQADASLPKATVLPVINSNDNLGIGYQALNVIDSKSSNNTAIGSQAFSKLTSSKQNNTALGYQAGFNQSSYGNCTFLGANADASVSGLTNAIAIGYNAKVSQSNSIVLGAVYGTIGSCTVGIGTTAPRYPLHIANSNTSLSLNSAIGLNETSNNPPPPSGANDIAIFAKKGNDYGAMYMINSKGSIYKFDSTNISAPASEPKIPVLTADEIQNLQEIALGAIVYDSTNDTVIISTKSGWQNLTRSLYNPQSVSAEI
jgi:hypothetical protein